MSDNPSEDPLWHANLRVLGKHTESWFVEIGNDFLGSPEQADKAYLVEAGFSPEFADLIEALASQGIFHARFDAEGYEVDGAPCYE